MSRLWRIAFESHVNTGVQIVNTLHAVSTHDLVHPDEATAVQVRDAVSDVLKTKYRNILGDNCTFDNIVVTEQLSPTSEAIPEQAIESVNLAGNRALANTHLAAGLCALASLRTDAPVRGGVGRMFMPPAFSDVEVDTAGIWKAVGQYIAQCTTFLETVVAGFEYGGAITDGDINFVVYSRTRHARGDANYWFSIEAFNLRAQQHFLRSRQSAP